MRSLIHYFLLVCVVTGTPIVLGQQTSGIGVAWRAEGEFLTVGEILPNTPAAASNAIHVGDRLIAVAQSNAPATPVKGLKIEEVVRLMRGPVGTTVRLTLADSNKSNPLERVVSIIRGELQTVTRWGDGVLLAKGSKAPNILMKRLDHEPDEELKRYVGRILVLEFWATWCAPCQDVMARLQEYSDKYPSWRDKVVLVGANVDDDLRVAAKHLEVKGWTRTHNVWVAGDSIKAFHVNALPATYVIDSEGSVVAAGYGLDIAGIVNSLLNGR